MFVRSSIDRARGDISAALQLRTVDVRRAVDDAFSERLAQCKQELDRLINECQRRMQADQAEAKRLQSATAQRLQEIDRLGQCRRTQRRNATRRVACVRMLFARRPGRDTPLDRAELDRTDVDPGAHAEGALVTAFDLDALLPPRRRARVARASIAGATAARVSPTRYSPRLRQSHCGSSCSSAGAGRTTTARVATVDTVTGCAGLVACALAVRPDDQFNAINWMFPLTLFSAVAGSAGFPAARPVAGRRLRARGDVRARDRVADFEFAPEHDLRGLAVRRMPDRG